MATKIYPGTAVTVRTDPPFADSDGQATDPTTVRLAWRRVGDAATTWQYGVDSQIVRDGPGAYHAEFVAELAGQYWFRWEGEGLVAAAQEASFLVDGSHFE